LIRNPADVADVRQAGAEAVVCDLEAASASDVAALLSAAGAVVFAVGAGPGSGAPRKDPVDGLGSAGSCRCPRWEPASRRGPAVMRFWAAYITAKTAGEDDLRARDLDWTIPRPDSLTDAPAADRIRLAAPLARSPAPTSPRSLPPCSTNRVPGTRRSS
jgi:hypothetical protein